MDELIAAVVEAAREETRTFKEYRAFPLEDRAADMRRWFILSEAHMVAWERLHDAVEALDSE